MPPVPVAALFRKGDDWAVFAVKGRRAHTTLVKVGHRNARMAEIVSGLEIGDTVVLHPSDRVSDGAAVSQRDVRWSGRPFAPVALTHVNGWDGTPGSVGETRLGSPVQLSFEAPFSDRRTPKPYSAMKGTLTRR